MNQKCPYCGFINFADAAECRKCGTFLKEVPESSALHSAPTYRGGVNSDRKPYKTERSSSSKLLIAIVGLALGASVYGWFVRPHVLAFFARQAKCEWTEYRPEGVDFTLTMPNKPTKMAPITMPLEDGSLSLQRFACEVAGQGVAGFTLVDYTGPARDMSKADELLNAEVDDFLRRSNSTLISKRMINYHGMAGVEFESTPPENLFPKPARNYSKFFITSTRFYGLFITGGENSEVLAGKDKFLNPHWVS